MKFITFDIEEKRIKNTLTLNNPKKKSKLNGIETIEFTTLDDHLKKYYRLVYKNKKGKYKEYIISSVELIHTSEGIEYSIYAEESIVETRGDFIEDKRNLNSTYASCGTKAFENTRWRVLSDSSSERHNLNFYRQSVFQSLSDILDKFNCEFETEVKISGSKVTDRIIYLKNRIGEDLGKRFAWSKDLEEVKRRVNEEDIITALYGFGKGEAIGDGYGRRITFADINNGKAYVENTDARDKYGYINSDGTRRHRFDKRDYDTDDVDELIELTRIDLENLSTPNITYTAKVIDLQSLGIDLEGVDIGDSVVIRDKEADITLDARVIELDEDLDNIQETTIILGNYRPVLGSKMKELDKSLSQLKSKESLYDRIANLDPDDVVFIDEVVDNLNKEFNAGTSNMFFDENRGLVITDKKDESLSNWIMELSSQGFRIANSKKSNGEWNFRTFGTGDGFTADQLITGIIRGGNSFWNLETGELNIGDMFIIDPNGNATLSQKAKEELKGQDGTNFTWNLLYGTEYTKSDFNYGDKGFENVVITNNDDGSVTYEKPENKTWNFFRLTNINLKTAQQWNYPEPLIVGNQLVFSIEMKSEIPLKFGDIKVWTSNNGKYLNLNEIEETYGKWHRVWWTHEVLDPGDALNKITQPLIHVGTSIVGKFTIRKPMIHYGTKPQPWAPHPIDIQGKDGQNGSDAIIISDIEPADKTKLWRKSITDPNLYIYIDDKWVEIDAQLQDIVLQVQEEISGQEDKWQGDINTNIKNVVEDLTKFQSDLSKLNDELTGKANVEQVLNEEEVKKTVEDIISKYPEIINLNQHFNFGTDGLRITATDASNNEVDTSVLIKNDGLTIEVEGQTAAYFKQNETLTPNLNVEGTAWVGNHAMLGFNGYDADGSYNENKNITAFAWSPRKKEDS